MATTTERSANLQIDINVSPYYDDFGSNTNLEYVDILFKPAYPVQARELSQIQTRQMDYFKKLGDFLMEEKSPMIGGEFTANTTVKSLSLDDDTVNTANFVNKTITDSSTTSIEFSVILVEDADDEGNPPVLIGTYTTGGPFSDGIQIETTTGTTYSANLKSTSAESNASFAEVQDGVFFLRGLPLECFNQKIILEKFSSTPSYSVGLTVNETIVDSDDDSNLLDNAQGSLNYTAPGADRYKIELQIDKKTFDSGTSVENTYEPTFYEYLRISSGSVTDSINDPQIDPVFSSFDVSDLDFNSNLLQLKRKTESETGSYTGANGEPVFDYENGFLYVYYNGTDYKIGDGANAETANTANLASNADLLLQPSAGVYRDGDYYLNYNNFTNTPTTSDTYEGYHSIILHPNQFYTMGYYSNGTDTESAIINGFVCKWLVNNYKYISIIPLPLNADSSSNTFKIKIGYMSQHNISSAGDFVLHTISGTLANTDSYDFSFTDSDIDQSTTLSIGSSSNKYYISDFIILNTFTRTNGDEPLYLVLWRDSTDVSDTYAYNPYLTHVQLFYYANSVNEDTS